MVSKQLQYFIEQLNIILKQENIGNASIDHDIEYTEDIVSITFSYNINGKPRFVEKGNIPLDVYKDYYDSTIKELNDDFYRNIIMRTEFLQKKDILRLEHYQLN
jgi:hypothetical protein